MLAWRDDSYLRLPARIDWLPERALNRELYLWLAALAVNADVGGDDWFRGNQRRVRETLARFPGLYDAGRVRRHLALRGRGTDVAALPAGQGAGP